MIKYARIGDNFYIKERSNNHLGFKQKEISKVQLTTNCEKIDDDIKELNLNSTIVRLRVDDEVS